MLVERVSDLTQQRFVADYLTANRPVIVVDAMSRWPARTKWTPAFFAREFGNCEVQVYDDLFDLVDMTPLADYLERNFDRPAGEESSEYVRWYTQLKAIDFLWSDAAFERLRPDWSQPYFLPTTGYAVPFCGPSETISATERSFPYKGLFLSGRGARTRLHRDPFGSEAVLCQIYGTKSFTFYAPTEDARLRRDGAFVDPRAPDPEMFPEFGEARYVFEDVLAPGEVLFIPDGWFHDVTSVTDSISVTWNFVHRTRLEPFRRILATAPFDREVDVARYFLSAQLGAAPGVEEMLSFIGGAPA